METLSDIKFREFLESAGFDINSETIRLQDDCEAVCTYLKKSGKITVEDIISIERVEYLLTESQKDELYGLIEAESFNHSTEGAFTHRDRQHQESLIYS